MRAGRVLERVAPADADVERAVRDPAEHVARALEQLLARRAVVDEQSGRVRYSERGLQPLRVVTSGAGPLAMP